MIVALFALSMAQAPLDTMKSDLEILTVPGAIASFRAICFDNFTDTQTTMAVINDPGLGLLKQPKTGTQAMQPGDSWFSNTLRVTYVEADWLPRDLPSPQCTVTAISKDALEHSEVAGQLASILTLQKGKIGKDKPRSQSRWDLPRENGDKWRIFLSSVKTPSGVEYRFSLLNLRGKKKKK